MKHKIDGLEIFVTVVMLIADDLVEILSLARPSDDSHEFYTAYCSLIVNVFFSATRDLRELGYLTRMNYAGYKQPVLDNQSKF